MSVSILISHEVGEFELAALAAAGLKYSPPSPDGREIEVPLFSFSASSLAGLRLFAMDVANGVDPEPEPEDDFPSLDRLIDGMQGCEEIALSPDILELRPTSAVSRRFLNLIHHGDCDGWYAPIEMKSVLWATVKVEELENMPISIGSSIGLLRELEDLASVLELPEKIDLMDDRFNQRATGVEPWRERPNTAWMCAALRDSARQSVEHHAWMGFC